MRRPVQAAAVRIFTRAAGGGKHKAKKAEVASDAKWDSQARAGAVWVCAAGAGAERGRPLPWLLFGVGGQLRRHREFLFLTAPSMAPAEIHHPHVRVRERVALPHIPPAHERRRHQKMLWRGRHCGAGPRVAHTGVVRRGGRSVCLWRRHIQRDAVLRVWGFGWVWGWVWA